MEKITWLSIAGEIGQENMEFVRLYLKDNITRNELANGIGEKKLSLIDRFKLQLKQYSF